MKALLSIPLILSAASLLPGSSAHPSAVASLASPVVLPHCQVPCGIYGDQMRIGMLLEDAATIEKAMAQIELLSATSPTNYNQIVRWVTTKDEHAQKIQQTVLDYWLAQRIKAPAASAGADAATKYHQQLALMHAVIVGAMKSKQTIDDAHVKNIREKLTAFSKTYFSKQDLEHLEGHQGGGH